MSAVSLPRRMWGLFEPIHIVTYFAPQARTAFETAGLRGFWRGYFAGRAAPLGPVGPGPVAAMFYGFARPMVARALPDIWTRATPQAALDARLAGAGAALRHLLPDVDPDTVAEAATLLRAAAEAVDVHGRTLAAANADLPWPDEPIEVLWQAATVLREHRGDGHLAALLEAGLDGCEIHVWRTALRGTGREMVQLARGWTDDDWSAAVERLRARGWLAAAGAPDGAHASPAGGGRRGGDGGGGVGGVDGVDGRRAAETPTDEARAAYDAIEAITDRLAARPWRSLGDAATERCAELLGPLAMRAWTVLPEDNPIGLARPEGFRVAAD